MAKCIENNCTISTINEKYCTKLEHNVTHKCNNYCGIQQTSEN